MAVCEEGGIGNFDRGQYEKVYMREGMVKGGNQEYVSEEEEE